MEFWSVGIYDLKISEQEFLELTPKLFDCLCKRKNENDKRETANAALVACMIYNINRRKNSKALTVSDFFKDKKSIAANASDGESVKNLLNKMVK